MIVQHELIKNRGWIQMLRKVRQYKILLFPIIKIYLKLYLSTIFIASVDKQDFKIQDFINKAEAQCATWAYSYYNINTYIGNKTKTQEH